MGTMSTIKIPLLVVVFRGFYSELEDAIGRMSEQVWGYFNYREHKPAMN
jgi:hypothetical protein